MSLLMSQYPFCLDQLKLIVTLCEIKTGVCRLCMVPDVLLEIKYFRL